MAVQKSPYKLIIIGDSESGKSSLMMRLTENKYYADPNSTIGVDFKCLITGDYKFHIWDTAGQERFRAITRALYKDSDLIMVAFDLNNRKSFENLRYWIPQALQVTDNIILVGCKSDLQHNISQEEIDRYEYPYFSTSSKASVGNKELLEGLKQSVISCCPEMFGHTTLQMYQEEQKKRCC